MSIVQGLPNMTELDPDFDRRAHATHAGMASWAMTGPAGTTCRECLHWTGCGQNTGRTARWNTLKPRACSKYRTLMNNKIGALVPHDTPSCRYFVAHPNPPPINSR